MSLLDRRQFLSSAGIATMAAALPKYGLSLTFAPPGASPGFFWGASTAAAQSEGSPLADGGGESIWDVFLRTPKATADGSNNLVADDEYHRWPEDLKLMQQIGPLPHDLSFRLPRSSAKAGRMAESRQLAVAGGLCPHAVDSPVRSGDPLTHYQRA
jgi:Glycosyl hydrolase family 1